MLSVELSSTAKKWAAALWRETGRAFVKKSARFFLAGVAWDKEDAELALIDTIT
jgi:hypothetical protein